MSDEPLIEQVCDDFDAPLPPLPESCYPPDAKALLTPVVDKTRLRIKSDGTAMGTSFVTVAEDGTETPLPNAIAWRIVGVSWQCDAHTNTLSRCVLELDDIEVEVDAKVDLPEPHPA